MRMGLEKEKKLLLLRLNAPSVKLTRGEVMAAPPVSVHSLVIAAEVDEHKGLQRQEVGIVFRGLVGCFSSR